LLKEIEYCLNLIEKMGEIMKTDSQIQTNVMNELKWDPSITHENIGVMVSEGIVTLTGTVPTYFEKWAAERAAQNVTGVKAVVEKLKVKVSILDEHEDQDIAEAIANQFNWNTQIPGDSIKAKVENGLVELTGEVEWGFQRIAAEDCIRGLAGVGGVTNNITIKKKNIEPSIIKNRIRDALKRKADREFRHINIEVHGSEVTLSGEVHSLRDLQDVKGAAIGTPGVTKVESNLFVK
jgi:osmotically-inducible protein OsmY